MIRKDNIRRTAITGGIGAGKSYVCSILREHGIAIYDCDEGAKRLIATSSDLKKRLTELIGPDTYVDGVYNRAAVTRFLLASEENKFALNAIVHPAVIDDFYASGMEWMECAILYEAHLEDTVDRVVCVVAPEEVRISRIVERDGITAERAAQWLKAQMPQEEAAARADFVVTNDGTTPILPQIEYFINENNK